MGAFLGFGGYLAAALAFEEEVPTHETRLSYGQEVFLVSLPITTMTGAAIGVGLALAIARRFAISIFVLLATAICEGTVIAALWRDQIGQYGRDRSEVVLFQLPLYAAALALVAAATVGIVAAVANHGSGLTKLSRTD